MRITPLLFVLLFLISACDTIAPESSATHENSISTVDSISLEVINKQANLFISNDSLFTIEISKTVAKINNGFMRVSKDSMQYTCIELKKTDGSFILLQNFKSRSPAMPEHYLSLAFNDSINFIASDWSLVEQLGLSTKFYFAFDEFDKYGNKCEIKLGYPGWYDDDGLVATFNLKNFNSIVRELKSPQSNATIANQKWFKTHGR
jgi:hypothetical protein